MQGPHRVFLRGFYDPLELQLSGLSYHKRPRDVWWSPDYEDQRANPAMPCGLRQDEMMDLMFRDIKPEDYELLSKLDEIVPKTNTANRSVVDELPRVLARTCANAECGVCLSSLQPDAQVVKLPCEHVFHPACIEKWLTQCKNACPLCSAPIQGKQA